MKKLLSLVCLALLASVPAMAHVKVGVYKGTLADGQACSFEVKGVTFADNLHHPLNERVEVVAKGMAFVLSHLPMVDAVAGTVAFDHEHLTGAKGTLDGGVAFVLRMEHSASKEGPADFTFINHDYAREDGEKKVCGNLIAP